jgi:hypothetical protein
MKILLQLLFLFTLISCAYSATDSLDIINKEIQNEAMILYKSEMASWNGGELFYSHFHSLADNVGGYISYSDNDFEKCVMFSKGDTTKVLATFTFDSTFDSKLVKIEETKRNLSCLEKEYFDLRSKAIDMVLSDTFFVRYKNTTPNIIPIIDSKGKRVYILTGHHQNDIVIFGNDYLINFDNNNNPVKKIKLHKDIIVQKYEANRDPKKKDIDHYHRHDSNESQYATATDLCTLFMFNRLTKWDNYYVVSNDFTSLINCKKRDMKIINNHSLDNLLNDKSLKK